MRTARRADCRKKRATNAAVRLAVVLFGWLLVASGAQAQTCPAPVPNCSPTGAPVAPSSNHHYFVYNGQTVPLLGMSYENICHICLLPTQFASLYCSLTNYPTVFSTLHTNKNNIIRLVAIFNSSPGFHLQSPGAPFPHEQPFVWNGSRWDLSQPIDSIWLQNIEAVVCSAYSNGIVVQVTLFDPWDPGWAHSPFNPVNTLNSNQGFTADQYFASFDNPSLGTDTQTQNVQARTWQKGALTAVVNQLKKYPNVIWQIANEPDLNIPGNVPIANVVAWEKAMAQVVQANDNTHIIMINGHSSGSFAWNVPGATIESAHYTQINNTPGLEGAIGLMRDSTYNAQKLTVALGFDENQSVPNDQYKTRTTDDVRAEAWEFVMDAGGLFNAYSYNMSTPSQSLSTQLKVLYNELTLTSIEGINVAMDFNSMQQTTCGSGNWCRGVPAWGTQDPSPGCGQPLIQNTYWSTMSSNHTQVLYIHHGVPMSQVHGGPAVFDGYSETLCGDGSTTGYHTALQFTVPVTGCWNLQWVEPSTGVVRASRWYGATAGQVFTSVDVPYYKDDIAVFLRFGYSGPCGA